MPPKPTTPSEIDDLFVARGTAHKVPRQPIQPAQSARGIGWAPLKPGDERRSSQNQKCRRVPKTIDPVGPTRQREMDHDGVPL